MAGHVKSQAFLPLLRMIVDEAGIHRASVHSLRHIFGIHMVKRGTNLRVVQEAMGHKYLKTTYLYVGLARERMNKAMQKNAL